MKTRALKYWQRLYLAVLLLFILCLFGGLAAFAQISVRANFKARTESFLYSQHTLAQQLKADVEAVRQRDPEAMDDLMDLYHERSLRQGLRFFAEDGKAVYYALSDREAIKKPDPGFRSWQVVKDQDGRRLLYAETTFTGEIRDVSFALASDMENFYEGWHKTIVRYLVLAIVLTAAFALGLWFMLARLNQPIRELEQAARAIGEGDLKKSAGKTLTRKDELGDLGRTLHTMAGHLETQMEELKQEAENKQLMIDDLGHEMRTPLTAIKGYAFLLQRTDPDEETRFQATQTIQRESDRLLRLSEQLLKLSVLRHDPLELTKVSLEQILSSAADTLRTKADTYQVQLTEDYRQTPLILGESTLLESLCINLIDNAIKACDEGGAVWLSCYKEEKSAVLMIRDNGRGMDDKTVSQLGRPFFRADKARSRAEGGAGLGLALCHSIVEAHEARIEVDSAPGKGTTVRVIFYNLATT